jgi:hypothetical protein
VTDWAFWATVVSCACLGVELANLGFLAYIVRWIGHAGQSIVSKISQSLNLRQGKGTILGQIKEIVGKVGEGGGDETPIEIPELGLSVTPTEIRGLAKQYLGKAKKGEVIVAPQGMDIFQKLATGKDVGMMDALPFIMQLFKQDTPGQGNGNAQTPARQGYGGNWDS